MATVRILQVLHSMDRGGAENAIMNYYRHVDRDKIQFDFLLTEPKKCHFEDEITSLGGNVYRVPQLQMIKPFAYLKAVSLFFDNHPEYKIVHSHTSSKSVFPLWIAKKKGIPVRISHSHNTKSENGLRGWIRNGLKWFLKRVATHFCACGNEAAIWLYGQKTFNAGKVTVVPNVIECSWFDYNEQTRNKIRSQLQIGDDTIVLGCVARFSPQKNLSFLIDIFNDFHAKINNSVLLLLGDGDLKEQIVERINYHHLENSVLLTGVVPNVSDYEQAMDIYLMPSLFEGLPLSLIEAQISGLKCFVSTGVPQEADKTGLVSFIPLEKGSQYWTSHIIKQISYNRRGHLKELQEAGYDAEVSAITLQEFYLSTLNGL